jgi:hypothetical protein
LVPPLGRLAAALFCLLPAACGQSEDPRLAEPPAGSVRGGAVWFVETARDAGVDFRHQRADEMRYWLPEIMSGGAAWLDYDSDGDQDLYLVQGGSLLAADGAAPGNVLYRNEGDGTFTDVSANSGADENRYGMGAAVGDFDGDGDPDIYVTNVGRNTLYANAGDGTFEDVTEVAGVGDPGWGSSAGFFDYDLDGDLDLFVVNYIVWSAHNEIECRGAGQVDYCHPQQYQAPAMDRIFRNEGDGTFSDVTRAAGIALAFGNGLGLAIGDYDDDGWQDVYVANDGMLNQLWINQRDGTFRDEALLSGAAVSGDGMAEAGMGVIAVDVEEDGDLDLFMTHLRGESNTLYVNDGRGAFEDGTAVRGLAAASLAYTGFGVGAADFDNDGALDLYVANGRVGRAQAALVPGDPFAEPNQLFAGIGEGAFAEVLPRGGSLPELIANSRGAAFADYDGDGDIDVLVVNNGGEAHLLRNVAGDGRPSIQLQIVGRDGRVVIGATVTLEAGGRRQWRRVQPAYSYASANDTRVHFGLDGLERVDGLTVHWPDGSTESFGPLPAGGPHVLRQGSGTAQPSH